MINILTHIQRMNGERLFADALLVRHVADFELGLVLRDAQLQFDGCARGDASFVFLSGQYLVSGIKQCRDLSGAFPALWHLLPRTILLLLPFPQLELGV